MSFSDRGAGDSSFEDWSNSQQQGCPPRSTMTGRSVACQAVAGWPAHKLVTIAMAVLLAEREMERRVPSVQLPGGSSSSSRGCRPGYHTMGYSRYSRWCSSS